MSAIRDPFTRAEQRLSAFDHLFDQTKSSFINEENPNIREEEKVPSSFQENFTFPSSLPSNTLDFEEESDDEKELIQAPLAKKVMDLSVFYLSEENSINPYPGFPDRKTDIRIHISKHKSLEMLYDPKAHIKVDSEKKKASVMLCTRNATPKQKGILGIFIHHTQHFQQVGRKIGLTAFMNGINVNPNEFEELGQSIYVDMSKRTVIVGLHNKSYGAPADMLSLLMKKGLRGLSPPSIELMKNFFHVVDSHFHRYNFPLSIFLIVHSEGALVLKNTLKQLPSDFRHRLVPHLFILTLGSVAPIPKKWGNQKWKNISVMNIYSKKDFLALFFLKKYQKKSSRYNIQIIKSQEVNTLGFIDHAFLSNTYGEALRNHVEILSNTIGVTL